MSILLVRHAQAGARSHWDGPDRDRPLSSRGVNQALQLRSLTDTYAPKRLLSSPYKRCIQTLEPLASILGIPVECSDALAEGNAIEALRLVRKLSAEDVAICTHGDVIPEILMALADEDNLALGSSPRQAKGSVWVLESSDGCFIKASYISPEA